MKPLSHATYECFTCGRRDEWGASWLRYGPLDETMTDKRCPRFCCDKCANAVYTSNDIRAKLKAQGFMVPRGTQVELADDSRALRHGKKRASMAG